MEPYSRFKKLLLGFGCFLIFQSFLAHNTPGIVSKMIRGLDDAFILVSFLYILSARLFQYNAIKMTPINNPLLILLLLGTLSGLLSKKIDFSLSLSGLFLIVKGFIIFYIFASVPFYRKDIELFFKVFLRIGLVIGIIGLIGTVLPGPISSLINLDTLGEKKFGLLAAQSVLGHPGYFAMLMAAFSCYTIAALFITREKKYLYLSLFFVTCIILSFRRTAALGIFVVPVGVTTYLSAKLEEFRFKNRKAIFLILLFILPFVPFIILEFQDLFADYIIKGGSPRELLTLTGIRIAFDYFPLGSGPGTFGGWISRLVYSPLFYDYNLYQIWGLSPENSNFINDTFWPHILAELGFAGTIIYIIIIFKLIVVCKRGVFLMKDRILRIFALGTFMLIFESLIESMKGTMYENTLCIYFWFGSVGVVWSLIKYNMKIIPYEYPRYVIKSI